jgi:3',5'-cyclic AMP phosphodiesterase CpdA
MRLIHVTDPHLSTLRGLPLGAMRGKRMSGFLSWTFRRQLVYQRSVLDRLSDAVNAESPDHLILSGDLVQIGLEEEIVQVRSWLADLAATHQVFFVPGNHDVYARNSWAAVRRHWHFVLPAPVQGQPDSPTASYPFTRDLGNIRLIGASSACVTPVFSSRGALGAEQIGRLGAMLAEAREKRFLPCLAIHHPPLPGMSPWMKALKETQLLQALIAEQQPALVCCGHLHSNIEVTMGAARIFCTASAASVKKSSFRIFDVESTAGQGCMAWDIHMRLQSIGEDRKKFVLADEKRWRFTLPDEKTGGAWPAASGQRR